MKFRRPYRDRIRPPLLVRFSHQMALLSRARTLSWSLAIALTLCVTEHISGYQLGFSRFYAVPVALVSWSLGRREGGLMALAALTAQ